MNNIYEIVKFKNKRQKKDFVNKMFDKTDYFSINSTHIAVVYRIDKIMDAIKAIEASKTINRISFTPEQLFNVY